MKLFNSGCLSADLNGGVSPLCHSYLWESLKSSTGPPLHRHKHSVCFCGKFLYLYGGRGFSKTHNDFWKYDINNEVWLLVKAGGDLPPPLEGHSIVEHEGELFMFGGEMSFASAQEVPLWVFNEKLNTWTKRSSAGVSPTGRREHVAVIYEKDMYIHGGYVDLKGPTRNMWKFQFNTNNWELVEAASKGQCPVPRYKHAAVVYNEIMWMCGGLMGITCKNETQVWTWDFSTCLWCEIRTKGAPYQLFDHAACIVNTDVFIFGGNRDNGKCCSQLWKVSIKDVYGRYQQSWHQCQYSDKITPPSSSNHCLVLLPSKINEKGTSITNGALLKNGIVNCAYDSTPKHDLSVDYQPISESEDVIVNNVHSLSDQAKEINIPQNQCNSNLDEEDQTISNDDGILHDEKICSSMWNEKYKPDKSDKWNNLCTKTLTLQKNANLGKHSSSSSETSHLSEPVYAAGDLNSCFDVDGNGTTNHSFSSNLKKEFTSENSDAENTQKRHNMSSLVEYYPTTCLSSHTSSRRSSISDDLFVRTKESCTLIPLDKSHKKYDRGDDSCASHYENSFGNKKNFSHTNNAYVDSPQKQGFHQADTVKKFSYNLSDYSKPWHPLHESKYKMQTTSFIEVPKETAIKDNKVIMLAAEEDADDVVTFSNDEGCEHVTLPNIFHENAKILNQLENVVNDHKKVEDNSVSRIPQKYSLLLVGGKAAHFSLHIRKPLDLWKCELHYFI